VAGLDSAIHVFFRHQAGSGKDVDARDKPEQGDFLLQRRGEGAGMTGRRSGRNRELRSLRPRT